VSEVRPNDLPVVRACRSRSVLSPLLPLRLAVVFSDLTYLNEVCSVKFFDIFFLFLGFPFLLPFHSLDFDLSPCKNFLGAAKRFSSAASPLSSPPSLYLLCIPQPPVTVLNQACLVKKESRGLCGSVGF